MLLVQLHPITIKIFQSLKLAYENKVHKNNEESLDIVNTPVEIRSG